MTTKSSFLRRGPLVLLAGVLTLALGSRVAAEVTVFVEEPLILRVGERTLRLSLTPEVLSGEGFELRREERGVQGTLRGRPVELEWTKAGLITGEVDGEPVRLTARRLGSQSGLSVEGWFGRESTSLTLTPTRLAGRTGRCDYALPLAGNHYEGWRTCELTRGPPVSVSLRLPESLLPLEEAAEAVLLTLMLSAEAFPPACPAEDTAGQSAPHAPSP